MRLSDPESVGTYAKEDLLDWSFHMRLIDAAARPLPSSISPVSLLHSIEDVRAGRNIVPLLGNFPIDLSAESPALALLKELRDKLEDLCQLERIASDLCTSSRCLHA